MALSKYPKTSKELVKEAKRGARNRLNQQLRMSKVISEQQGKNPCNASVEEVEEAYTGFCDLCGVSEKDLTRSLHIDHCHETGDFRGWLCVHCNVGLGMFKDSKDLLKKAVEYL